MSDAPLEAGDLAAMRRALRALVDASPLSMATIEVMAGLPRNYLPKILNDPPVRGLSSMAIFAILPVVGHTVALVPDPKAQERMKARHDYVVCDERQRRGHAHFRNAKVLSIVTERAKKAGKIGAQLRMVKISPKRRSQIARKAANTRWRAFRLEQAAQIEKRQQR